MTRHAAIDIGTNSVLMLIADISGSRVTALAERCTITRLGEGVDQSGQFLPAAVRRTLDCLEEYRRELDSLGVTDLRIVATSAARDAEAGEAFLDAAESILDVRPEIISGRREAEFSFAGACVGLEATGSVCVFDVGGGSTEVIFAKRSRTGATITECFSLNIGGVRLTERFLKSDPPTADEIGQLQTEVRNQLAPRPRQSPLDAIIGVAGTVTTLAALDAGLDGYDASVVHGHPITLSALDDWARKLGAMDTTQRRALSVMQTKRADVIVAGNIIVCEVLRWLGNNDPTTVLVASDRGVRWGLIAAP